MSVGTVFDRLPNVNAKIATRHRLTLWPPQVAFYCVDVRKGERLGKARHDVEKRRASVRAGGY